MYHESNRQIEAVKKREPYLQRKGSLYLLLKGKTIRDNCFAVFVFPIGVYFCSAFGFVGRRGLVGNAPQYHVLGFLAAADAFSVNALLVI